MYELPKDFPTTPSAIIRVAVSDFKKVLANPKHRVDMREWIDLREGICYVCLAGAVLIGVLGHPDNRGLQISFISSEVDDLTDSLDDLRRGYVEGFLCCYIDDPSTLSDDILNHQIDEFTYDDDGVEFIKQLESLASKLENENV